LDAVEAIATKYGHPYRSHDQQRSPLYAVVAYDETGYRLDPSPNPEPLKKRPRRAMYDDEYHTSGNHRAPPHSLK
jgi:hypothetical protein